MCAKYCVSKALIAVSSVMDIMNVTGNKMFAVKLETVFLSMKMAAAYSKVMD